MTFSGRDGRPKENARCHCRCTVEQMVHCNAALRVRCSVERMMVRCSAAWKERCSAEQMVHCNAALRVRCSAERMVHCSAAWKERCSAEVHLLRQAIRIPVWAPRTIREPLQPTFRISVDYLVPGLPRDPKLAAQ
jgi:hypothetical protein